MAKLHSEGVIPDRNSLSAKAKTRTPSGRGHYYVAEEDLDASGTLTLDIPAGHIVEWLSVMFVDSPSDNETNLVVFLNGDDTSDATKGFPIMYYLDTAFAGGDGNEVTQGAPPVTYPAMATQVTFLSGEANNTFYVYAHLLEEKNIGKNTLAKLNT